MVAVLAVGGVASTLVTDSPNCTDFCNDDWVKLATLALLVMIGLAWLIVEARKEANYLRERRRERNQAPDRDR